jgi:hypothetical protein
MPSVNKDTLSQISIDSPSADFEKLKRNIKYSDKITKSVFAAKPIGNNEMGGACGTY